MPIWTDNQDYNTQVQDLLPFDVSEITADKMRDFLQSSIRTIIDSIPKEALSSYALTETSILSATGGGFNATNKKIINVLQGTNYSVERPYTDIFDITDENSMHFATSSSPAFVISPTGVLKTYPVFGNNSSVSRSVDYIEYPKILSTDTVISKKYTYSNLSTNAATNQIVYLPAGHKAQQGAEVKLSGFTQATDLNNKWFSVKTTTSNTMDLIEEGDNAVYNITQSETSNTGVAEIYYPYPRTFDYPMILLTAIKVAQFLLGRFIHTAEDIELTNSMQLEIANLQTMYQEEMKRIIG